MPSIPSSDITGLIFAGGLARRMEGREKGLLSLRGRPLIRHVLERLEPQVGAVLINANRRREEYAAFGPPVVGDLLEGFPGPLAGLQAGLQTCRTPFLATAPCDAPLLPNDLIGRLSAALAISDAPAAAASTDGRLQPTFLLCRREVLAGLEGYLAEGGRSIHGWLERIGTVPVAFADAGAFANINTPGELAALENAGLPE